LLKDERGIEKRGERERERESERERERERDRRRLKCAKSANGCWK
jgi:hypothetical protein